jgi:phospholipase/lecithinase/hemolysin
VPALFSPDAIGDPVSSNSVVTPPAVSRNIRTAAGRKPNSSATPKNIFYIGDSYLDNGNYEAITGLPPAYYSDQPPWSTDVNMALGLTAVGRWTSAGSLPNPLGTNYAVAGAGITVSLTTGIDTSLTGQTNLMLSDYPNGLPADTLVVVAMGTNDVLDAMEFGGLWSTNRSGWQLNGSGFTIPASGASVTVSVVNLTGIVAGSNNMVIFQGTSGTPVLTVTATDPASSTVTLTNFFSVAGTQVAADAHFEMAGLYVLNLDVPLFVKEINALLAAGANLVVALPQRTDILPFFYHQDNQAVAYSTWSYLYYSLLARLPLHSGDPGDQINLFDFNAFFSTVFFNPSWFGFTYNNPGWNQNPTTGPNIYVFWDDLHPSGRMHQLIAGDFILSLYLEGWSK